MTIKSKCARCGKEIIVPSFITGTFNYCLECNLKNIEETIVEVE